MAPDCIRAQVRHTASVGIGAGMFIHGKVPSIVLVHRTHTIMNCRYGLIRSSTPFNLMCSRKYSLTQVNETRDFRKGNRAIRGNRASSALKWKGASWTGRGGRRSFSREISRAPRAEGTFYQKTSCLRSRVHFSRSSERHFQTRFDLHDFMKRRLGFTRLRVMHVRQEDAEWGCLTVCKAPLGLPVVELPPEQCAKLVENHGRFWVRHSLSS